MNILQEASVHQTLDELIYRLTHDDTIGKPKEMLAYKSRKLKELVDTIRQNDRSYWAAVSEKLLV